MNPGSKEDARTKAKELFLKTDGKMTNVEIAKSLQVHPLTVGKWKRADEWESKLEEGRKLGTKERTPRGPRNQSAHGKAMKLYLDAGGHITNKELATQVGVSPASIANWKATGGWTADIQSKPSKVDEPMAAPEVITELLKTEKLVAEQLRDAESPTLEIENLVAPAQIIQINRRMDEMLLRGYLTAEEVADLARAKGLMLGAVMTYLAIVQEMNKSTVRDRWSSRSC